MADFNDSIRKILRSYAWGAELRDAARFMSSTKEKRGRPVGIDGARAIENYVELEARARIVSSGKLMPLLRDTRIRIANAEGRPTRLDAKDRSRLRKRYAIGKKEIEYWRGIRVYYGAPVSTRRPEGSGEDHPTYLDILRKLDDRIAALTSDRTGLFFLTDM